MYMALLVRYIPLTIYNVPRFFIQNGEWKVILFLGEAGCPSPFNIGKYSLTKAMLSEYIKI